MGIPGLLPMLKEHLEEVPVSSLRGATVGVDGYSWMYKALSSFSVDAYLSPDSKETLDSCVAFIMKKCYALMGNGVLLYFVFDGEEHPMKKETSQRRKERKEEARKQIEALLLRGRRTEAYAMMSRCLTVTPQFLLSLMNELKDKKIPFLQAPYEADPQLAYLEKKQVIDYIATEDSDLIVYGAKKILFKLNENRGAQLFNRERILERAEEPIKGLLEKIKEIVSLSGCDYTDGIKKIGLISAHRLIMTHQTAERAITFLSKRSQEALLHKDLSQKVICTFTLHVVSDPHSRRRTYFEEESCPLEKDFLFEDLSFVGSLEERTPLSSARGNQSISNQSISKWQLSVGK